MPLETYGPHNAPNQFYNRKGQLTSYALACGYVERFKTQQDRFDSTLTETELYWEHCCYHIRSFGPNVPNQFPDNPNNRHHNRQWDTAQTLTGARKVFARHIRAYHRKSKREVAN